jgi:hypothetical protein
MTMIKWRENQSGKECKRRRSGKGGEKKVGRWRGEKELQIRDGNRERKANMNII